MVNNNKCYYCVFSMTMFTQKALNVTGFSLSITANGYMSTLVSVFGMAAGVDRLCKKFLLFCKRKITSLCYCRPDEGRILHLIS
jgi:hypothetical protein